MSELLRAWYDCWQNPTPANIAIENQSHGENENAIRHTPNPIRPRIIERSRSPFLPRAATQSAPITAPTADDAVSRPRPVLPTSRTSLANTVSIVWYGTPKIIGTSASVTNVRSVGW